MANLETEVKAEVQAAEQAVKSNKGKILTYLLPLVFFVGGIVFAGVLHNYAYNNMVTYITSRGCTNIGKPGSPEAQKYLGNGYSCGGVIVATPNYRF